MSLIFAIISIVVIIGSCGCSTCYVTSLRCEYAENKEIVGVYSGQDEYPTVYPATIIATTVEVPTWWYPSGKVYEKDYITYLWPVGAICSLVDVPISMVTDTLMLPYDLSQIPESKEDISNE